MGSQDQGELLMGEKGVPRLVGDVEKGTAKADSYIAATERSGADPRLDYSAATDDVKVVVPPQYVGLTKEELEKYRNDPFWRKLRLFLFVLFWLLWVAMFVAAIVIVAVSPRCADKTESHWWQKKISYQVWTPSFKDSDGDGTGDLAGLSSRVNSLRRVGVQTLWPTPLLSSKSGGGYDVTDFDSVDPLIGTNDDLSKLVGDLHGHDMYAIMDLPLSATSTAHDWFARSANNTPPYADYYYWQGSAGSPDSWSQDAVSKRYYLHWKGAQFTDYAALNWDSEDVRKRMAAVLTKYVDMGFDGFYIGRVDYLARDGDGPDWNKVYERLAELRGRLVSHLNETDSDKQIALFTSLHDDVVDSDDEVAIKLVTEGKLNYVVNRELTRLPGSCSRALAVCVHADVDRLVTLHKANNETWPMWEFGSPYVSRIATRLNSTKKSELFHMMALLLPGSLNFYYGDAIGMADLTDAEANGLEKNKPRAPMQWNAEANAGFSSAAADKLYLPVKHDYEQRNFNAYQSASENSLLTFKRLARIRLREEVLNQGDLVMPPPQGDVLLFSRFATVNGNATAGKIYAAAINLGSAAATVRFGDDVLPLSADERAGTVVAVSAGQSATHQRFKKADLAKDITLLPEEGVVFKLVKKMPE